MAPDPGAQPLGEPSPADEEAVFEAPALLRILWADPQHTAEHIALWSVKHFARRASAAVERLRRDRGNAEPAELQRAVVERQTRVATTEGAVVGGPFIVLVPVAFCAALPAQAQMALELAVLAGHAAEDEMRAADLLLMQKAYTSEADARAALAKVTRDPGIREGKRLPRGTRLDVIKRMAFLLGVLESSEQNPSRIRSLLQWTVLGLIFVIGFVLPLIWVPYMALSIRRGALSMGERGIQFYVQGTSVDTGVIVKKASTLRVPMVGGLLRTLALVIVPILVATIAFSTGFEFGGGRLLSAGLLLIAVSILTTCAWFAYRWWRQRRRPASTVASP